MTIDIRPATLAEMSQFGLIGAYVYAGSFGDGPDNMVSSSMRPEWTLCAFDGGRMVTSFATIPFTMRAFGKSVPLGGVSAVGTIPEYRRRGLLRNIMTRALADMRDAGQAVSALWASQAAIYQRYQFAMTTVRRAYRIDTVDIGFYDGDAGGCTVERVPIDQCFDAIKQMYIAFVADRMCYLHRSRQLWQLQVFNEDENQGPVHVAIATDANSTPVGYLVYTARSGRTGHATRGQELRIRDLVWLTPDAYRSLWRFVASHDLVGTVTWSNAPLDDPAQELFTEPRLLDAKDTEGCWFRLVDVAGALAQRGYAASGSLTVSIDEDSLTPWNQGSWQLETDRGEARVTPARGKADIEGSIKSLTALYTGFRSARDLAGWGLIRGNDDAIARADQLFGAPHAPHCPDNF
jgi:predicted acetyltransferase